MVEDGAVDPGIDQCPDFAAFSNDLHGFDDVRVGDRGVESGCSRQRIDRRFPDGRLDKPAGSIRFHAIGEAPRILIVEDDKSLLRAGEIHEDRISRSGTIVQSPTHAEVPFSRT
jgi:hypothetical protein